MLRIAVEVTGTVCGAGCSIFSQTVDRLPPLTADRSLVSQVGLLRLRNASTRWRSVAVVNPLHAGDAYVSRDTTTARKTVRSQSCRGVAAREARTGTALTDNSPDTFWRWQVACDRYPDDFQHILTRYVGQWLRRCYCLEFWHTYCYVWLTWDGNIPQNTCLTVKLPRGNNSRGGTSYDSHFIHKMMAT